MDYSSNFSEISVIKIQINEHQHEKFRNNFIYRYHHFCLQ